MTTIHTRQLQQYTQPTNNNYTQDNLKLKTKDNLKLKTKDNLKLYPIKRPTLVPTVPVLYADKL